MIKIISNDNYEAIISLLKHVCDDIKKGVKFDAESLENYESMLTSAEEMNNELHKDVRTFESKRFCSHRKLIRESLDTIRKEIENIRSNETPDFSSMSKEELIEYIMKSRSSSAREKSVAEEVTDKPQPSGKENEENGDEGNGSAEDNGEFNIHD